MSIKEDMLDHRNKEENHEYVASHLNLDPGTLYEFPFEIEYDMQGGVAAAWLVYWQDGIPEDRDGEPVETEGSGRVRYSRIPAPSNDETTEN